MVQQMLGSKKGSSEPLAQCDYGNYDEDYYGYLLSTENLWGNGVSEYASRTFYPNFPEEIKEKYQINDLIKYIPKEAFKLDDY